MHTLTQTCHSSGMQGMHVPPREWSSSIQRAELPTVACNLGGSKCVTTHPPNSATCILPEWVKENYVNKPPTQRPIRSSDMALELHTALWCETARSVGLYYELYALLLSHFKGLVPVWSAEEGDGFLAGELNVCRETFTLVYSSTTHLWSLWMIWSPARCTVCSALACNYNE